MQRVLWLLCPCNDTHSGHFGRIYFLPGSKHDSKALKQRPFHLEQGSRIYADAGYTNYKIEDMFQQAEKKQFQKKT